jgi:hypothetical protein
VCAGAWPACRGSIDALRSGQNSGRDGGGRSVAVQGAFSVGAGGGGRAVAVQGNGPAPSVDGNKVVEAAQEQEIGQRGRAAAGPGDYVVHLAARGLLAAAGEGTVPVPADDGAAQVRRDGAGGGTDVERQADGRRDSAARTPVRRKQRAPRDRTGRQRRSAAECPGGGAGSGAAADRRSRLSSR